MPHTTKIHDACKLILHWSEFCHAKDDSMTRPHGLVNAVGALKRYLELEKADGKSIRELEIADYLLKTREGDPLDHAVRAERRIHGSLEAADGAGLVAASA